MLLRGLRKAGILSARHLVSPVPASLKGSKLKPNFSLLSPNPSLYHTARAAASNMSAAEVKPGNEVEVTEVQKEEQKLPVHDPATKFRKDYKPTPFSVDSVNLNFILNEDVTHVHSTLSLKPNYQGPTPPPLKLDGRKDLKLVSLKVNGTDVKPSEYSVTEKDLTLAKLPAGPITLNVVTEIKPQENSSLEGLYKSSGNFCTQCEAEGFRGITYFLDRPDVMAKYQVRVEADKANYPVLLSNGNLKSQGDLAGGRHYALWEDPFPKPCYLFALVAGKLSMKERMFKTMSGKDVALRIFVQESNLGKVDHALESLVKAMKWDEETFGLEYDLNLFNIVAVDDFNMGAMENKSLNIFNSRLVLASPETATDLDYSRIEGVVGHEYFHNYTGNRVTCRDWFQLTLKEGLTVFRDQEFTADLNSRPVKRIEDVMGLRVAQFPEDAGPMAHPIRPDSYIKMDNFYTMTVYEKGAEVVRLYNTLLGKEGFRKGMDLYFKRHDGHAVTCDDFLAAMADANHVDLSQLGKWYGQAGTPRLTVSSRYDAASQRYTLRFKQHTPPTPGQPNKEALLIPVAVGLVGPDGKDLPLHLRGNSEMTGATANGSTAQPTTVVLRMIEAEQEFVFENVPAEPVPSIFRGFSAPVRMTVEGQTDDHLLFLLANDSDEFNRWEAGQRLSRKLLLKLYGAATAAKASSTDKKALQSTLAGAGGVPDSVVSAFRAVLMEKGLDGSFKAMAATLPSGTELLDEIPEADPTLVYEVRNYVVRELAARLRPELETILKETDSAPGDPYVFNAAECARRTLKQKAISMLSTLEEPSIIDMILQRFREATNMTDQVGALGALVEIPGEARKIALAEFFEKWKSEPLVILKWLGLQAMSNAPGNVSLIHSLVDHPAFNISNPNNCYSLFLAFSRSPVNFHAADGSGYGFMGDSVLRVDKINHQVAARMVGAFTQFRQFDKSRQNMMRAQLERIVSTNGISENVYEICTKSLSA